MYYSWAVQYGSTQTGHLSLYPVTLPPFTFHFGSSQTLPRFQLKQRFEYLHSTMVLLKPSAVITSQYCQL